MRRSALPHYLPSLVALLFDRECLAWARVATARPSRPFLQFLGVAASLPRPKDPQPFSSANSAFVRPQDARPPAQPGLARFKSHQAKPPCTKQSTGRMLPARAPPATPRAATAAPHGLAAAPVPAAGLAPGWACEC
ncbi:hypothetical protein ABPG77_010115 [Micractinium sp. CCAP 211/92]